MWAHTALVGQKSSDVIALYVDSVNKMIDLRTERVMLRERSRIPGVFWAVLYAVTILSLATMGYHGGVAGTNRSPVTIAVAIAFSAIILLIADLDRPGEGVINVRQQAMIDLRDSLTESGP